LEAVFLIVVFGLLLWMGCSNLYDSRIVHDFPHGYFASDAYWNLNFAQTVYNQGNYRYLPFYIAGGYKDVLAVYPPLFFHLVAGFSYTAKIQPYDALLMLGIVFMIFSALIMYLIIRSFNRNVAILSLVLLGFLFYKNFYVGVFFGKYGLIIGNLFFLSFIWALDNIKTDKSYLLIGLFLGAAALIHPPELFYAVVVLVVYFGVKLLTKRFEIGELKKVFVGGIISITLSIYYLIIFYFTEYKFNKGSVKLFNAITTYPEPVPAIMDFHIFLVLIALGIIFCVILIIKKKYHLVMLASLFMLAVSMTNYIGNARAFHTRYLWPIYLSFFAGLGIYQLIKLSAKRWNTSYSVGLTLIIIIIFMFAYYKPNTNPGLADPYTWEAMQWVKENTDEKDRVYVLYGDAYGQSAYLFSMERMVYRVDTNDYVEGLQRGVIKREYKREFLAWDADSRLAYRKGMLSFGYHVLEEKLSFVSQDDICDFDYYLINKVSRQPALARYNMFVREKLLSNSWMEEVYSNAVVSIVKNNKPGADCIE
jgi:hypothetical protein